MAFSERICARELVKFFAKSSGTSAHQFTVSEQIRSSFGMLPFKISGEKTIASNGLNPNNREVAVFLVQINEEGTEKVVKIGVTYDNKRHGHAFDRADIENNCSDIFEKSELGEYVIPSRSIVVGGKDFEVDVRVQDFGKGVPLCDLDLSRLDVRDIDALIKYHSAVLAAVLNNGFQCEPGYSFKRGNMFQEVARVILMGTPLVSQNVLYDTESKEVRIVDPGYSIPIDNPFKKMVFGGIVGLEYTALKVWQVLKSQNEETFNSRRQLSTA